MPLGNRRRSGLQLPASTGAMATSGLKRRLAGRRAGGRLAEGQVERIWATPPLAVEPMRSEKRGRGAEGCWEWRLFQDGGCGRGARAGRSRWLEQGPYPSPKGRPVAGRAGGWRLCLVCLPLCGGGKTANNTLPGRQIIVIRVTPPPPPR